MDSQHFNILNSQNKKQTLCHDDETVQAVVSVTPTVQFSPMLSKKNRTV